ncbi:unnamed protein product [Durusdinium trenchii]|uniref:Vacuolar protein sorting-associated protein 35 n=1 Tax=Durusdinium trenchii TaxID=1381693 RepID=A0ABP0P2Z5_9DINO
MAVVTTAMNEANLLAEACSFVAEHRFYLRKAVQHGDFYKAIRHSLSLANELRSSRLDPQNYYKLYSMVYVELQYLGAYLLETERHGFSLEEVFEIVQYEGNCLPRLYLLVTVGMARMLATSESDEILQDLDRMVRAVQHPVRGLFLRYFLLQVVKDKLQGLRSGMMGALTFLLGTFKEVVILWQRLRLEVRADVTSNSKAWELDEYRFSLRLLLGAHLMEISRLEGLTTQLYAEVVLPELLNLVPACEDAAGQAYLLQLIVEVFGDAFHLHTLEKVLATCAEVHWSVDLKPLTQHLLSRLTSFLADMGRMGEEVKGKSALDVFGLFHSHMKQLHSRPRTAATPLDSLLELQLELCMFVLALNTGTESCMELLRSTVQLLEAPGVPCPLETKLAQAVVDLMAAPLTQESLASVVLAMPYHKSLLAMMSQSMQARGALAMVSALLAGDVRLQDSETVQNLFLLTGPLLRDKTGKDDPGEDLMRHLEHDPLVFRTEQETMAQLIHQVRQDDPKVVFEMLSILWKHFEQGGPHRIVFTVPAMVAAVLELARRAGGHAERWPVKIFDFTHTLCSSLGTLAPRESLRLWLLCSACADNAAAAEKQEATRTELVQRISSSMDNALLCLERNISEQEARLRGLQLLVGTLRQMRQGMEEGDLKKVCDRAVALANKMLSKRFQSMAFCLCCEMFWLPRLNFQDADRGLLCLRRALQSADGAIHSDPLDVGLFVDILDQVIRLFAEGASQVSAAILSKILALCVQHIQYIGNRVPVESMRALRTAIVGLAAKQNESMEAVMAGDVYVPYLEVDLRPAEQLPAGVVEAKT